MLLPKISLITPTYNQAEFLPSTLESIIAQDYPNLEHIVVDAMSTDDTPKILEVYGQRPGVRIIREPDKGQSDAINKGTKLANGEITGWLNSDDVLCPGALKRIGEAFAENPGVAVVYGLGAKMDRAGNVMRWVPFRPFDRQHLRTAYRVVQPAMYYRRDIFLAEGGLDIDLHYAMDWDLLIRLAKGREVISLPDKIAQIRYYEDTKTSTGGWNRMREIAMIGKRHNGLLDWNLLSFRVRNFASHLSVPGLRRLVDGIFSQIGKFTPIMVLGWPETNKKDL